MPPLVFFNLSWKMKFSVHAVCPPRVNNDPNDVTSRPRESGRNPMSHQALAIRKVSVLWRIPPFSTSCRLRAQAFLNFVRLCVDRRCSNISELGVGESLLHHPAGSPSVHPIKVRSRAPLLIRPPTAYAVLANKISATSLPDSRATNSNEGQTLAASRRGRRAAAWPLCTSAPSMRMLGGPAFSLGTSSTNEIAIIEPGLGSAQNHAVPFCDDSNGNCLLPKRRNTTRYRTTTPTADPDVVRRPHETRHQPC
ncbi:hypothetical protein VTI74DRAFT_5650 [Chaetomium olivicolor]